jgi:hypothetical protein
MEAQLLETKKGNKLLQKIVENTANSVQGARGRENSTATRQAVSVSQSLPAKDSYICTWQLLTHKVWHPSARSCRKK